jgi:hypothetical protein
MAHMDQSVEQAAEDARRDARVPVRMQASLREQSHTKFDVWISDLSAAGFRCESSSWLKPDTIVWLTIPGFAPIESVVVWRNGHISGCRFTTPLHVAVLEHVARLHPHQVRR